METTKGNNMHGTVSGIYTIAANTTGLSKSTLSRIINGHRPATLETMEALESIGWAVCDQLESRRNGTYPVDLQDAVERHAIRKVIGK